LLVVASDATANRQDLMRAAERLGGSCLVHGDMQSLGRLLGREVVAVAAVTDREIAAAVREASLCADEMTAGAEEGTGEK
jgi:ribosomal protein L7Ae-like RNA K-turn-binding protein